MLWYFRTIKNYAVFKGRARRKEYWFFFLFNLIVSLMLFQLYKQAEPRIGYTFGFGMILYWLYLMFILIPGLSVGVRRLHDVGKSGWWLLVPIVNLVFLLTDSDQYENDYGPNPKNTEPLFSQSMYVWKMRFIMMGIAWLTTILIRPHGRIVQDMHYVFFGLVIFEFMYRTRKWLKPITGVVYLLIIIPIQIRILPEIYRILYEIENIFIWLYSDRIFYYHRTRFMRDLMPIVVPIVFTLSAYIMIQKLKKENETNIEVN